MTNTEKKTSLTADLKKALSKQKPQHDTAIGILHPYWARKPLNTISSIIKSLTKKGDIVFDPFVGSGTIPISSLIEGRKVIASDLNPLSIFITKNLLNLSNLNKEDQTVIKEFFERVSEEFSKWFLYDDKIIERIRYEVEGEYKNGKFQLNAKEIVTKKKNKAKWASRSVIHLNQQLELKIDKKYLSYPIDFRKIELPENSRIAIPQGALLSHFFDDYNIASINLIYDEIIKLDASKKISDALMFILSSSIPLLRLSDKKASSQWPYWRPKNSLTSRNPLFVIKKRVDNFIDAIDWMQQNISQIQSVGKPKFFENTDTVNYCLFQSSAQDIVKKGVPRNSVDLILTDPPYADQAPYLEYSELWNNLLLKESGVKYYNKEIVRTDAPKRKDDNEAYIQRLCLAFDSCCHVLKNRGYFVFYYQDRNLKHWAEIYKTLKKNHLIVIDVFALPKQRRSMKTVTSPGRTLDGDLVIVAQKISIKEANIPKYSAGQHKKQIEGSSLFEKYASLIRKSLIEGTIEEISKKENDIFIILDK